MHKRVARGFTIVEIATVVFIIAILATVTIVVFNNVQSQSRDTKRDNDMLTLGSLLNKYYEDNGSYPVGCGDTTCASGSWWGFQAPDNINITTTLTQLGTILNTSSLQTIDPLLPNSQTPFTGQYYSIPSNVPGYVYRGGQSILPTFSGTGSISIIKLYDPSSSKYCSLTVNLSSSPVGQDVASYVLAYYSQADNVWNLYMGKYGVRPTIDSGSTSGYCVIKN